jgi:hypothetical protein
MKNNIYLVEVHYGYFDSYIAGYIEAQNDTEAESLGKKLRPRDFLGVRLIEKLETGNTPE